MWVGSFLPRKAADVSPRSSPTWVPPLPAAAGLFSEPVVSLGSLQFLSMSPGGLVSLLTPRRSRIILLINRATLRKCKL